MSIHLNTGQTGLLFDISSHWKHWVVLGQLLHGLIPTAHDLLPAKDFFIISFANKDQGHPNSFHTTHMAPLFSPGGCFSSSQKFSFSKSKPRKVELHPCEGPHHFGHPHCPWLRVQSGAGRKTDSVLHPQPRRLPDY